MLIFLLCAFPMQRANALTISTYVNWASPHTITGDLVIANNGILVINGTTVSVTHNIDVKPGGELFIEYASTVKIGNSLILESGTPLFGISAFLDADGTSATTRCTITALGSKWKGIQVWGNLNSGMTGTRAKAHFIYATVEKAEIGVATYNTTTQGKRGGVVQAAGTIFKNDNICASIKVNPFYYATFLGGPINTAPATNSTAFGDCQFLLTGTGNPFLGNSWKMMEMYDVKGVTVTGCTFKNETNYNVEYGILMFNSDAEIGPGFPTPNQMTKTSFDNLDRAIYAYGPHSSTGLLVQQCDVSRAEIGIGVVNEVSPIIIYNYIHNLVPPALWGYAGITVGYGTSGFTLEANNLDLGNDHGTMGIFAYETGAENNVIYRDTVSNYKYGIVTDGINGELDAVGHNTDHGLRIICNNLKNDYYQGAVGIFIDNGSINLRQGNSLIQGIPIWRGAGNSFVSLSLSNPQVERGVGAPSFDYYYSTSNPNGYPGSNANYPVYTALSPTCPVHQAPIITRTIYSRDLSAVEENIRQLSDSSSLTAGDSAKLNYLIQRHHDLIDSMMFTFMYADTPEIHYDSLAWALEQVHYGYTYQVTLAGVYLTQLRFDDAINLLRKVPSDYNLDTNATRDLQNMADMYEIIDTLVHNGHHWDSLNTATRQEVDTVANRPGVYGKGVAVYLLARYENKFFEPSAPISPDTAGTEALSHHSEKSAKIYPNPTTGLLHVTWLSKGRLSLQIFNIMGGRVLKRRLRSGHNTLSIGALPTGIYSAHIFENGKSVYQQKIIKE